MKGICKIHDRNLFTRVLPVQPHRSLEAPALCDGNLHLPYLACIKRRIIILIKNFRSLFGQRQRRREISIRYNPLLRILKDLNSFFPG